MKEKFDPMKWRRADNKVIAETTHSEAMQTDDKSSLPATDSQIPTNELEIIVARLEASQVDITAGYSDWCNIGFAIAAELGEAGREYYHRISRFYPKYSQIDCDKQYDNCLNAKGHGITMKTFFHLAKQTGIDIHVATEVFINETDTLMQPEPIIKDEKDNIFNTPQLPDEVYLNLPEILRECCELFQGAVEKDVFLIGSIAVLSGCLPNVRGIYFDEPCSPHLYAFITSRAASGKGKMRWSKLLGQVIHDHIIEQYRNERDAYEIEMERYSTLTKSQRQDSIKPIEPAQKMFFIPANSSSSAFIAALSDNNFSGVIFETEADTLAATFKQEWGNFSDVLRKAFHHESTSMFRRKDNEFIEIRDPHLAIALSGTPNQVHNMMPNAENGLFSRFLYYAFEDNGDFKNPFVSHRSINYTDFFMDKASVIFDLYQQLSNLQEPVRFQLTEEQSLQFTEQFNAMLSRNKLLMGGDFNANIKRLGLITFRIAMILSALRILEEGELPNPIICSSVDFKTAMTIATTLEKHAIAVFQNLPNNNLRGKKLDFFEKLPQQFDRQGYLKVAEELGIHPKAAEKYIGQFVPKLLKHCEHNQYTKLQ